MLAEFGKMSHTHTNHLPFCFFFRELEADVLEPYPFTPQLLFLNFFFSLKVGILWQTSISIYSILLCNWDLLIIKKCLMPSILIITWLISDFDVLLIYHISATFSNISCLTFPFTHEYLQGLLYCLERQQEILTMFLKNTNVTLVISENNNATQHKSLWLGKNV